MSKLDRLLREFCPDGVEYRKLGDCCKIEDNKRKPIKASDRTPGKTPYYGANNIQDYVDGFTHNGEYVLIAEDGSSNLEKYSIQYVIRKFWANNHVHVVKGNVDLNTRFLYHYLTAFNFVPYLVGITRAKLNKTEMLKIPIPLPPLPVQEEIVRILDNFTELTTELSEKLTAELTARKKQYEYYRDELLTFGDNVEWKTLGEVAIIKNGKTYKGFGEGNIPVYGSGGIMIYIDTFAYDKPTVLIPRKGSIDKLYYVDEPFWNVDTIFYTVIDEKAIKVKFLFYYLESQRLERLNTAGGVPSLTQAVLKLVKIPIPSLSEQERIVSILDKFDAHINDISIGLPAEIEARQKQYEYYREKLLSFKELDEEA